MIQEDIRTRLTNRTNWRQITYRMTFEISFSELASRSIWWFISIDKQRKENDIRVICHFDRRAMNFLNLLIHIFYKWYCKQDQDNRIYRIDLNIFYLILHNQIIWRDRDRSDLTRMKSYRFSRESNWSTLRAWIWIQLITIKMINRRVRSRIFVILTFIWNISFTSSRKKNYLDRR